jgi:hypothetical protein
MRIGLHWSSAPLPAGNKPPDFPVLVADEFLHSTGLFSNTPSTVEAIEQFDQRHRPD